MQGEEQKDGVVENKYGKLTWRPKWDKLEIHNRLTYEFKLTFAHLLNLDFVNQKT